MRGCYRGIPFVFAFAFLTICSSISRAEFSFQSENSKEEVSNSFEPRKLDGVTIEAVETYLNPKQDELGIGLGYLTSNPYYMGFAFNAGYTRYFNKSFAWEIINASYFFTVDRSLTNELADSFGVEPQSIERAQFLVSSNIALVHTYGKMVFLNEYIRYFRSTVLLGFGLFNTSVTSKFATNVGLRLDAFISNSFSWRIEVRDAITFTDGLDNNIVVHLGTGINF